MTYAIMWNTIHSTTNRFQFSLKKNVHDFVFLALFTIELPFIQTTIIVLLVSIDFNVLQPCDFEFQAPGKCKNAFLSHFFFVSQFAVCQWPLCSLWPFIFHFVNNDICIYFSILFYYRQKQNIFTMRRFISIFLRHSYFVWPFWSRRNFDIFNAAVEKINELLAILFQNWLLLLPFGLSLERWNSWATQWSTIAFVNLVSAWKL